MNFSAGMPGWGAGISPQAWMQQWQALFPQTLLGSLFATPGGAMPGAMPGAMFGAMPGMGTVPGMMPGVMPGLCQPGPAPAWGSGLWDALLSHLRQWAAAAGTQAQQAAAALATQTGARTETSAPAAAASGMPWTSLLPPWPGEAQLREWLTEKPVGPMREHIERWQQVAQAQLDYHQAAAEFGAQLGQIAQAAQAHFEQRLAQRAEAGEPLQSPRALFDEWVEAGEAVWAEQANGDAFISALGRYGNAELRLRAALQTQLDRLLETLGLPSRAEVDADHRRIAHLERELRRLKADLAGLQAHAAAAPDAATRAPASLLAAATATSATTPAGKPVQRSKRTPATRKATRKAAGRSAPAERTSPAAVSVLPVVTPPRAFAASAGKPPRDDKRKQEVPA